LVLHVSAQTAASSASATTAPRTITSARNSTTSTSSRSSAATSGAAPDVYLNVPELHVGRIELTVDKLSADLNLNAKVANLVQLNAGVQVSVEKVNITIAEVDAEVELVIRLGM
jgi:exo-beta-1,3-glucanase (GH17 family)